MNLDTWVEKLSASSLPIFSETVRAVTGVVSRREPSAHDLAAAIGKDAAMAARLLKIANSPMFNLQHRDIDTISSAVVLLGFDAVRELAVSLALIEQVLRGRSHELVTVAWRGRFTLPPRCAPFLQPSPEMDKIPAATVSGWAMKWPNWWNSALLTPDRKFLRMKQALDFTSPAMLDVTSTQPNIYQAIIQSGKSLMVTARYRDSMATLLKGQVADWLGKDSFVVTPVSVSGKVMGVLYADNERSRAAITDEAFSSIRHFGQQIALGIL